MAYADDSSTVSHTTLEFGKQQMNYFAQEKQVSPEKLVLGIPFYGRGYTDDGHLDYSYYRTFAQLIAADPANYDRDVYNGIAYNGAPTVRVKCNYAKNYGGVMIWQLAQDAYGEYRFEVYVCNPINYQNIEDEKLNVNGTHGGYQKNMNFDMPENTELCHEEQVVLDFSNYQTGDSDCIKLTFLAEYFDNEVGRITSTRGNGHLLYFYVGENGVGISKDSVEDAEKACQEQRSDEIVIHDAYTGKWNDKFITRGLFDALSSDTGEQIPVWMSFTETGDFTYKGKNLGEYDEAQHSEEIDKLDQLLNSGDVLKYGEAVYTTGTPDGTKWGKELYDARVEFFGEELLSKYIVDGEFLKDQLTVII